MLRNKFTPPANVSVLVLHITIVIKVARGGSVYKPRGSPTANVSVYCYRVLPPNFIGVSCGEC